MTVTHVRPHLVSVHRRTDPDATARICPPPAVYVPSCTCGWQGDATTYDRAAATAMWHRTEARR